MRVDTARVSQLLALIYEAATDSSTWPRVLAEMQSDLDSVQSSFLLHDFTSNQHKVLAALPELDASVQRDFETYYGEKCVWAPKLLTKASGWTGAGNELVNDQQVLRSEYYNDFLRKLDLRYIAAAQVKNENRSLASISFLRSHSEEDFDRECNEYLALLTPHIRRSLDLGRDLGVLKAKACSLEALVGSNSNAILLLDAAGDVLFVNPAAEEIVRKQDGVLIRHGRLEIVESGANTRLHQLIALSAHTSNGRHTRLSGAITVWRSCAVKPLYVRVSPLHIEPSVASLRPSVIVLLGDPDAQPALPHQILSELFDLTPRESQMIAFLWQGKEMREIAAGMRLTYESARSYLKQIYSKTGTRRQSELLRLINTLTF